MDEPLFFALVIVLAVVFYVLADGFDLGVGVLFLVAPRDADRDTMMESVEPDFAARRWSTARRTSAIPRSRRGEPRRRPPACI